MIEEDLGYSCGVKNDLNPPLNGSFLEMNYVQYCIWFDMLNLDMLKLFLNN